MATIYTAQIARGANDGSSPSNAYAASRFATPSTLSPGDVLRLCDDITSLSVADNGTLGSSISIVFQDNARLTVAASTLMSLASRSYIRVDGALNGVIQNTDNGTNLGNQNATSGIVITGASNIEILNVSFRNLFVNDPTQNPTPDFGTCGAIYANGYGAGISIHDCSFDNIGWVLNFQGIGSTGLRVWRNQFTNYDHGVAGLGNTVGAQIYGNTFGTTAIWDTPGNIWHHDGIHVFFGAGVTCAGLQIFGNTFEGDWGVNNTAHIFLEGDFTHANPNALSGFLIAANLHKQATVNYINNGFLDGGGPNWTIINNTYVGSGVTNSTAITTGGTGLVIKNNIVSGVTTFLNTSDTGDFDYNLYSNQTSGGNSPWVLNGSSSNSLAAWRTATSAEANSIANANALLNSNGSPTGSSAAITGAANLTSTFDTDILNRIRPAPTTAWCIGAFEGPWGPDALVLNQNTYAKNWIAQMQRGNTPEGTPSLVISSGTGDWPDADMAEGVYAKFGASSAQIYVYTDDGNPESGSFAGCGGFSGLVGFEGR